MKKILRRLLITGGAFLLLSACGEGSDAGNSVEGGTDQQNGEEAAGGESEPLEEGQTPDESGDTYSFATSPQGTSVNAIGNGLASMINQNSDVSTSIQPYAGINAWLPLLNEGEIDLGVDSAPDMIFAYQGNEEVGYDESLDELRLIVRGNFIKATGLAVREDSDIESVADLEGKRVASDFSGATVAQLISEATLYANGLSWDDVNEVPVPSIDRGVEGLQNNQLDATFALVPSTPLMQEAHSTTGLKGFDFLDDYGPDEIDNVPDDVFNEIKTRIPAAQMTSVQPEGYLSEETTAIQYPNYLVSSTHMNGEDIYEMLEALWEHHEELYDVHPWLKTWNPEQMFDESPEIPYHEAAVEFFKDQGIWTDEAQEAQDELTGN
ncbi:TAXI family TRAP transporter solute-binding subunit [Salibacterium aidingense]|uniref:TAXI family TRAP transporter solute-binding subunit n=1 Tax=Salibacterium aidingense TaxID=384933 RepID=UPI000413FAFD|nr:TAXI family TRAP transporter solute-binding subunit [Salibacterium aidingense]